SLGDSQMRIILEASSSAVLHRYGTNRSRLLFAMLGRITNFDGVVLAIAGSFDMGMSQLARNSVSPSLHNAVIKLACLALLNVVRRTSTCTMLPRSCAPRLRTVLIRHLNRI